jgi:hypothetical protein
MNVSQDGTKNIPFAPVGSYFQTLLAAAQVAAKTFENVVSYILISADLHFY